METKMSIDPERIHEIFNDCLFKDNESYSEYLPAKGLTMSVGFHPERTEKHASEVHELCMNLLAEFQEDIGGGHSFLYICVWIKTGIIAWSSLQHRSFCFSE